jgi:hypothetical protein
MKNIIYIAAFFLLILSGKGYAQCKPEDCLAKVAEGFTFLKTYKMEKVGDQMEYSYVFSKETNYLMMMCNGTANQNIIVTIYDSNRKEVASNFDKKSNKVYPAISYRCNATGIYYMKFSYMNKAVECCVGVLAFKK